MDITPRKYNSELLYQRGDKKVSGVVDLSRFASGKKQTRVTNRGKAIYEIRRRQPIRDAREKIIDRETPEVLAAQTQSPREEVIIKPSRIEKNRTSMHLSRASISTAFGKPFLRFAVSCIMIPSIIFSFSFIQNQIEEKGRVLGVSMSAYENIKSAAGSAYASDFGNMTENFSSAELNFAEARQAINGLGLGIGEVVAGLPVKTPVSTAQNLAQAGENLSAAGKTMSQLLEKIATRDENAAKTELLKELENNIQQISLYLSAANENLVKVDIDHIPSDMQPKIILAQKTLPSISGNFANFAEDYPLMMKMLGSEKTQTYLLLFQNNSEIRATGGFIGSYGILEIANGEIKNLTVDGIFNPDGQLTEKIIPPMPIQKISASWSMHDSNWFADFPTSAQKAALFYEKTGGTTVDGVIAITPEAIKKMMAITGPIEMKEYNLILSEENFVMAVQNQVENLYDKEENKPKKILSDLAPIMIEKLFKDENSSKEEKIQQLLAVMEKTEESLSEKHILVYHRDEAIEEMLQKRGWGGQLIQTNGDYLSVVNSNINGYKTDAVIQENISLETEILIDGSVINTLTVNRKHMGGKSDYDWYNRVNANYMRVYLPEGSILLEATGNTKEEYTPPINYDNFKTDSDVKKVESTIRIEPDSGTQIFEESGKTVFGNWVFVSPQEEVTVTYKYKLPFKIDFESFSKSADAYTIMVQKQSGSVGSNFESEIKLPENWQSIWKSDKMKEGSKMSGFLTENIMYGIVIGRDS